MIPLHPARGERTEAPEPEPDILTAITIAFVEETNSTISRRTMRELRYLKQWSTPFVFVVVFIRCIVVSSSLTSSQSIDSPKAHVTLFKGLF